MPLCAHGTAFSAASTIIEGPGAVAGVVHYAPGVCSRSERVRYLVEYNLVVVHAARRSPALFCRRPVYSVFFNSCCVQHRDR